MKKYLCMFLAVCFLFYSVAVPIYAGESDISASADQVQIDIPAKSGVLIDMHTGTVLYEKNPHEKLPPASVTKIMTLLLVMESIESGKLKYTDNLKTSTHASQMGGSQIWLKENEEMSVEHLIKATAIGSANDAATVLAEAVGGSEEGFVAMMNQKAAELSMLDTTFKNPTGLDEEGHVTSAYDIALMSKELLKHKAIIKFTSTWMDSVRDGQTHLVNTNKLVRFYKGCTGLKTGTTSNAGSCVSVSAERETLSLISVVMGCATSKERFDSARALLDYGFSVYELYTPNISKEDLAPIPLIGGTKESVSIELSQASDVIIAKGKSGEITSQITLAENLSAPIIKGQILGKLSLSLEETEIIAIDIIASEDIKELTFLSAFFALFKAFFCV